MLHIDVPQQSCAPRATDARSGPRALLVVDVVPRREAAAVDEARPVIDMLLVRDLLEAFAHHFVRSALAVLSVLEKQEQRASCGFVRAQVPQERHPLLESEVVALPVDIQRARRLRAYLTYPR